MLIAELGNPAMSLCIPVVALPRKNAPTAPHKWKLVFKRSDFCFFLDSLHCVLPRHFPFIVVLVQPGPEIHNLIVRYGQGLQNSCNTADDCLVLQVTRNACV